LKTSLFYLTAGGYFSAGILFVVAAKLAFIEEGLSSFALRRAFIGGLGYRAGFEFPVKY